MSSWRRSLLDAHFFFFQAEDGIRGRTVTGVQTCALPISQTPGAPSGAGVGLGAAPPTGVSAFGSRIATSGGLSQGGAVGTVAGSESFPISAFLSSPPPHAADSTSRKQMKEKQIGREGLSDLIIVGRIVS